MKTKTSLTPPDSRQALANILVVDDKPANVKLLSKALKTHGYLVRGVLSGQMALRAVDVRPDLILLDIMMPEMSGFEVCQQLKSMPATQHIPVIFLSALNDTENKLKAFEVGGADYITKPFQIEEVLVRVNHQVHLQQLQRQLVEKTEKLKEQNQQLQQEIQERALVEAALRQAEARERERACELQQTLKQLKLTQSHMIQQEKMSSLGQLVAGIAHEINNPVSFIYGNLQHARAHAAGLLRLIQRYQQALPFPPEQIQAEIEDINLAFIIEDFPKLITSMDVGASRICEIVRSLKTFSHHSEAELKWVDIHQGLDSTLMILKSRLKANGSQRPIEVVKEYGNLPLIECYPGQLNQVFMNLISNAVDALEDIRLEPLEPKGAIAATANSLSDPSSDRLPTIRIRTQLIGDRHAAIYIADNGPGISTQIQQKLFDPFFTTKEIGKGTGLGLSISYQIAVDQHGGELRCISAPGQGAVFIIEVPLEQRGRRVQKQEGKDAQSSVPVLNSVPSIQNG
ncbi:MAG: response regulator [Leptolyngbyaceae cyanobacterium SM1_1_3]|nr:response regulator [Leptolyngbyaceae cyanobacterium SM1_1_3]NJN03530.1 response regulator [Leptolyngbyaceae cyanobacterium RM1_1_2]NJO10250.1 response regulator [Leptolyngbyaceae cyanobacterium SL_1_1]